MDLQGKAALVLGGIRGIGKAVALALAQRGMMVAVTWFDWESALPALEADLAATGARHLVIRANLLDTDAIPGLVDRAASEFGRLDVLVNNIERGGWPVVHGPYTGDQWDLEMATTLRAKRWAFETALPHLCQSGNGAVVNISSIAGQVGRAGPAAPVFADGYAAANRGVSSLTETWARMAAPRVRVNELMLGFFETRHGPGTRGWDLLSDAQRRAILDHTLLNRTGTLEDAARAALFLIADAPFMTGAVLRLDGGYVLGGDAAQPVPQGVTNPGESVFGE
ncbi:MAG: SDR family oxidoreductase [Proteobacteria bacterium]|nr:SDR family oxidoreductase [Pseudomonadota bacterium]